MDSQRAKAGIRGAVVALIAAALALFWHCAAGYGQVVTVEEGPVLLHVVAPATVEAEGGVAEVRPLVGGTAQGVYVQVGQKVQAGDLLAELDPELAAAQLNRVQAEHLSLEEAAQAVAQDATLPAERAREAEIEALRKAAVLAANKAERQEQLLAEGVSSAVARDQAVAEAEIAAARLRVAEARQVLVHRGTSHQVKAAQAKAEAGAAAILEAQQHLQLYQLRAPLSGVIVERNVDPGDTVVTNGGIAAPVLFEIVDPSRTSVRAEIDEGDVSMVTLGQRLVLTAEGGSPVVGRGRIARKGPRVGARELTGDPTKIRANEPALPVFIEWEGSKPPDLPLGFRLEARIEVSKKRSTQRLPRWAVTIRDGEAQVRIPGIFTPHEKTVRIGVVGDEHVEVLDLDVGTKVLAAR